MKKKYCFILPIFILTTLFNIPEFLFAEGSASLYPQGVGGRRAYLMSWPTGSTPAAFNPFPTPGTMKVYVKTGETIYVGSSAQGKQVTSADPVGTIILKAPNGNKYSSGTTVGGTVGLISTRAQELAGPNRTGVTSGYTPYTRVVQSGEEGIWEIDFVSPKTSGNSGTTVTGLTDYADAQWTLALSAASAAEIAAFDVSVGSAYNPATLIPGRMYCNVFNGTLPGLFTVEDGGFNGVFYVLTSNGTVYKVDNNGQNGFSFAFFVNNKGLQSGGTAVTGSPNYVKNGTPSYLSADAAPPTTIYDPRLPDNGAIDINHKLFFAPPANDLPVTSDISFNGASKTTTWLKKQVVTPLVTNLTIMGAEGVPNVVGPKGAYINFNSNSDGSYKLVITCTGFASRTLTGTCVAGANSVLWDGKDGNGTSVSGSVSLDVTASLWASEVHFPFVDVEINTKGFIIQRLNTLNAPVSDIVYWDDSNITTLTNSTKNQTPSNPKPNGNTGYGLSSTSNGHKWGAIGNAGLQGTSDFGNNRTLDTWTYVPSSPVVVNAVPILAKKLDLELTSITPSLATTCPGSSVTYTIVVKNLTGTGYVDAVDAKFGFTAPSGFNITGYTFTQTSGTASQSNVVSSGNQYTANINLTVGGTITYTITGTVSSTPGIATAYIMRPADVTDVDATSSTGSGIPTDPQLECDGAAGGGSGCNNIKTATVTIVSLTTTGIANGMCSSTGAQTTGLTYTASTSNPNSYSIDWNTAANNAGLVDQGSTSFAFAVGGGTMTGIVIPANTPGGTYSGTLTIRNASGCTNSYPISLTLGTLITAQPVATSTCSGTGTVAFTVTAINATGYLWKKDGVNVTNGTSGSTVISGATTSTLTITNPTSTNAGSYTVAVIGSCGNVTSNAAALTISALPAITSTGVVAPVCYSSFGSNQTTTMPYTATTNSPISYSIDWNDAANTAGFTDQGTTTFAFVPGGGTITGIIILAGVATGTIYNGTMTVTTVNGCTATKAITYTPNPLPTVTTTGIAVAKCYSASPQTTTLPYTASTNSPTSYSIDWDEIANAAGLADQSSTVHSFVTGGSTITSIAITAGTPNGRYNGVMTYTNANGCTNTVGVSLTIGAAITVQPVAPAPVCSGSGTVILSVTAEGSGTLTYRWRKGGSNLSNGGVIAGATTATLTLTNPTAADAGIYDVVVTSSCGSVTSNAVMVTVGYPTNVTATANQTSICEGSTLTLTGTADGATSWSWSGPNGFTSTLKNATVPGITTAGSGVYTLTATNGCGSTTASTLSVTVNSLPPTPTVSTTTPTNVCPVKTVNLTTLLTNAAGMTVLYKLTNSISGTDVTIPASVGAGTYYIFYQNASGCTSSSSTAVTVTISNCPPLPLNDINTTYTNKPVSGNVLTNDSDPEGNTLTVTTQNNVTTTHGGTVTVNSNGTYTYTPANGYTGTDTFSYQVCDYGNPSQCSTATVAINVIPLTNPLTNDPPVANNDTYTVEQGQTATVKVLANDSDPDGNTLTVTSVTGLNSTGAAVTLSTSSGSPTSVYNASGTPAGTAYVDASGNIVFTPTATYTGNVPFNYTISDGNGGTASASALITVLPANETNDVYANDDANAAPAGTTMTGNILTNDSDPEGNTITITAATANGTTLAIGGTTTIPGVGTLSLASNGTYTFVPAAGFVGTVNVPYNVCDNGVPSACDQATLYLTSLKSVVKVWTGNTSTDFNTNTNWTMGVVPVNGDDIVFATTANNNGNPAVNDLVIPVGETKNIGNLTNASTKNLVIPANTTLIVNGVVSVKDPNTGANSTDPGKIQIKAAENTPNGTFIINCTAQSTSGSPDVYVTVDLYAKGFKDAMTTWIDNVPGSPTFGTTFSGSYHWQHFGLPVASVTANPTFYGSYLRKYFENYNGTNTQYYQKWKDLTNESNLIAFEGYEITQDFATTYSIPGKLQYCDKTITLTRSAPLVTGAGTSGTQDTNINNLRYGLGQNIFGNSYTASIDITKLNFPEKVEPTVYLYNTGRFTDWSTTTNGGLNDGTALSAGQYTSIPKQTASAIFDGRIPSLNGFLLFHRGDAPYYSETSDDPVTMTLPYANNLLPNTRPQTVPREPLKYLHINLASKSTRDNLWLFSQEGTTNKKDEGWDGRKFFGTPTAFIYTENADGPMQVNADKTIDGTVLSFYANDDTDYTLTLTKTNLEDYTDLQLIDLVTRTVTPLSGDMTTYHFTADNKGTTIKRFIIANSAYIDLNSDKFRYLDGYVLNNDRLIINNFTPRNGTMYLHDISGKTLINRTIPTAVTEIPVSLQSGVYIMNLQADGEQEAIKLIIK